MQEQKLDLESIDKNLNTIIEIISRLEFSVSDLMKEFVPFLEEHGIYISSKDGKYYTDNNSSDTLASQNILEALQKFVNDLDDINNQNYISLEHMASMTESDKIVFTSSFKEMKHEMVGKFLLTCGGQDILELYQNKLHHYSVINDSNVNFSAQYEPLIQVNSENMCESEPFVSKSARKAFEVYLTQDSYMPTKWETYCYDPEIMELNRANLDVIPDPTFMLLPESETDIESEGERIIVSSFGDTSSMSYDEFANIVGKAISELYSKTSIIIQKGLSSAVIGGNNFYEQIAPMVVSGVCSIDLKEHISSIVEGDKEKTEKVINMMSRLSRSLYQNDDAGISRERAVDIYMDIMRRNSAYVYEQIVQEKDPASLAKDAVNALKMRDSFYKDTKDGVNYICTPESAYGMLLSFGNPVMMALYLAPIILPMLLALASWSRASLKKQEEENVRRDLLDKALSMTMAELAGSMSSVLVQGLANGEDPQRMVTQLITQNSNVEKHFNQLVEMRERMLIRYPKSHEMTGQEISAWQGEMSRYIATKTGLMQTLGQEVDFVRARTIIESSFQITPNHATGKWQIEKDSEVLTELEKIAQRRATKSGWDFTKDPRERQTETPEHQEYVRVKEAIQTFENRTISITESINQGNYNSLPTLPSGSLCMLAKAFYKTSHDIDLYNCTANTLYNAAEAICVLLRPSKADNLVNIYKMSENTRPIVHGETVKSLLFDENETLRSLKNAALSFYILRHTEDLKKLTNKYKESIAPQLAEYAAKTYSLEKIPYSFDELIEKLHTLSKDSYQMKNVQDYVCNCLKNENFDMLGAAFYQRVNEATFKELQRYNQQQSDVTPIKYEISNDETYESAQAKKMLINEMIIETDNVNDETEPVKSMKDNINGTNIFIDNLKDNIIDHIDQEEIEEKDIFQDDIR